ncbi:MAG: hypothetical protein FE041_01565, partial [Thermoplasmata archaeon]
MGERIFMKYPLLKIGLLEKKKGIFKKENILGWQYYFSFNNPLLIRDIIEIIEYIKLELERDMELLGAKTMLEEFYESFNRDIKPKLKEHLTKCNTIEEVHAPFPEDLLTKGVNE